MGIRVYIVPLNRFTRSTMNETTCDVTVATHTAPEDDDYKPNFGYGEPDRFPHGGVASTVEGA
jgi:hypothetical protein